MENKKTTQVIITGILVCILIIAVANAAKRVREARRLRIKHKVTVLKDGRVDEKRAYEGFDDRGLFDQKEIATEGLYKRLEAETKDIELKRDPFFSSGIITSTAKAITDVHLSGILWDENAPLAMIDDTPVGIGDKAGAYTILEIHKDRVILTDGTKDYELRLPTY